MKRSSRHRFSKRIESKLSFIKLSFAAFLALVIAALPFIIKSFSDPRISLDSRSQADEQLVGPIQSWVISPNGGEIISGNTEIQFFAKNASDANAKFAFTVDLIKGGQFNKNLFSLGIDQQLADRNGIKSKFVDLTGVTEGTDYKLKLTSTDATGKNVIADYSDGFFTISANNAKPIFTTAPTKTTLNVGQAFSYDIVVKDTYNSNIKLVASTIPSWLTLNQNKLSGTPTASGVYSVAIVAVNELGRQTPQVFSINVVSTTKPTTTSAATTPTATPTGDSKTSQSGIETYTPAITIKLPAGDRLSRAASTIETTLPDELKNRVRLLLVEVSKDGGTWTKEYEGSNLRFDLDTNKYEGGEYYLRFTYTFDDGSQYVKSYGPVHIVKQNQDQQTLDVTIKDVQPQDGKRIVELKPLISATFVKPAGANIDTASFKLELDGKDISKDFDVKLSPTGFSYTPASDLSIGKHEIKLSINAENAKPTTKSWSFEIIDQAAEAAKNKDASKVTRNRILIAVVLGLIILIFLLALWAIALSRKEQEYYLIKEERKIVEQPPIPA